VTYPEDQRGYPHPDHLKVHEITVPAFEAAGDGDAYPDAGPPWQPLKLYYTAWSRRRIVAMHQKFLELGLESPFDQRWFDRPHSDQQASTTIDISGYTQRRDEALQAHATQVDPTSRFWFGLPPEIAATVFPIEEYVLARSVVPTSVPEDDLFAGVAQPVTR
jgi:mycothiol S-conjugate amidase